MPFAFLAEPEILGKVISGIIVFFATTALSFVAGRWWGNYQARKQWERKHFLDRINVSLNSFTDGWLRIRTIFERSLEQVFQNPIAIEKVRSAAQQTTAASPLLPLVKEDRWYLLNFVLNAVSESFSSTLVRYDAGERLRPVAYLLFLTCEVVGQDRIRKVRAMMVRKDVLENFLHLEPAPKFEQEWHRDRLITLRHAADVYKKEPDNFLTLEIYV